MTSPGPSAANVPSGLYYEFNIPMGLYTLVQDVIENQPNNPNQPQVVVKGPQKEWFSQPRVGTDPTTEVITVNFKEPVSITGLSWEALRVGVHIEAWYQDRQNNWRQMMDENYTPIQIDLSNSQSEAWYQAAFNVYPIVGKAMQLRLTRVADTAVTVPYCVALRNILPRRDVFNRSQGILQLNDQQDPIGNVISNTIKDWNPSNVITNTTDSATTYWRSSAQPDPSAVVSLYLDTRSVTGAPQLIDRVWIDPVYTNQNLNLYYSSDDTVGALKISPLTCVPTSDVNTQWVPGTGRVDLATGSTNSTYTFPMNWGPLVSQDAWIGVEWTPNFAPGSGPSQNPQLLKAAPTNTSGTQWWPVLYYDVGAGAIVLELTNGTTTQLYSAPLSPTFAANDTLRIVAGWTYENGGQVVVNVVNSRGASLASYSTTPTNFPTQITLDGSLSFQNFRGTITAAVIKLEPYTSGLEAFQANAVIYANPDPVQPDPSGNIPSTTLDNAIYAVDFTTSQDGIGGSHESFYEAKTWTPILSNYVTQKGFLYLPQQTNMKYLKLEFSNLTEEPYPVYDAGVKVQYQVYPLSVIQQSTQQNPGLLGIGLGLLAVGANILLNGIGSVNWLSPSSVNKAVNDVFGQTVQNVAVIAGPGYVTGSLPNTAQTDIASSTRSEVSSPWVYRRSLMDPNVLASQYVNAASSTTSDQSGYWPAVTTLAGTIVNAFEPVASLAAQTIGALPIQGDDWWVFPGQTLKMPAIVMAGLTAATEVVLGRKPTTETRVRFLTTSVHTYDIRTVTRDAAIGYFAGVREVQAFVTSYIATLDPKNFSFNVYNPNAWVFTNINQLTTGPVTVNSNPYALQNADFYVDLSDWTQSPGTFSWDGSIGYNDQLGAAMTFANGTLRQLTSTPVPVSNGNQLTVSAWVNYANIGSSAGSIYLDLVTYLNGAVVGTGTITGATISNPTGTQNGLYFINLSGTYTVPAGVDHVAVRLNVDSGVTSGQVWFDHVQVLPQSGILGTVYQAFNTQSTMSKLTCTFSDSGLVRSDAMWAQADPLDTNISSTALAYYTGTIPSVLPQGNWGDTVATWGSTTTYWGEPESQVSINVDPNRIYQGKRVLHFLRGAGAQSSGITVRQTTNMVPNALARLGAVWFKPTANNNQITVRLRRYSDGVYIYQETLTSPAVGYWYQYQSNFFQLPNNTNQLYTVEIVLSGSQADELYLNDLYVEVAQIQYFVRLGDPSQFLHNVTPLVYSNQAEAIVSCTTPVTEFSVQASILSDNAYAYGMTATPLYLK